MAQRDDRLYALPADFTPHPVPSGSVPQGALTDSPETRAGLSGALLRRYLDAGSILMAGDVLQPRDRGFLAAVLAPGSRAISVGVDAITDTPAEFAAHIAADIDKLGKAVRASGAHAD